MLPDYGQGATQMFSQRNNPYCDLLSKANIQSIFKLQKTATVIY